MGRLPPMRSTMAPKGIRSSDPVRAGLAASRAISRGSTAMAALRRETMGPKADTPAKPPKKARVVQTRAARGLDAA